MRITNGMMMRKYMTNLNTSLSELNDLNRKVSSGMKFQKMSEDTAGALKAFQVRRNLSRISLYKTNIQDATSLLSDIEASVATLNETLGTVSAQVIQAKNGTYNESGRKIIAGSLRQLQQQVLEIANSKFSGKFVFGGSNVTTPPFTVDAGGKLSYNGSDVDTGVFGEDAIFIDVGLGIAIGAAGQVDPNTAFNKSYPGSLLLGTGKDADGLSNNLYNIVGELAAIFENNNLANVDKYAGKLEEKVQDIMVQYANIGEKSKSLEFLKNRLDTDEYNAMNKQNDLEAADPARSILDFKNQEMAYNAALQMGTKVLQPSLIDYLR